MTLPLLTLWQRGVYLSKAAFHFSPDAEKEAYQRVHKASALSALTNTLQDAQAQGTETNQATISGLNAMSNVLSKRSAWYSRRYEATLKALKSGILVAYGFEPPRRMESQPYEIPAAYWAGRVRWDNATLTVNGLEFIEVRVLATQVRDRLVGISHETTTDLQRGRPSIKADVEEAFATLLQKGLIDISKSAKSHFPLVRQCLQTIQPGASYSDTKPGDEGIRTYFSPLFNELKKTNKQ
ncbi:hypothetical protein [Pseudophaeobacter profundi]|uniref:hypothetical protein n=1 Tax=Pseudophaeobacter profundi TaxID=3034152 RepID=UPI00242EEB20|nr:hypothetical protein [Pseudophaeobacter profundi]